jgi:glutamate-1-semialdehyde 2,1-aminomutase
MWCLYFGDSEIINVDSVQKGDFEAFKTFFWASLEKGVYVAPSPYETGFLSLAHSDRDIDDTLEIFAECLG